MDAPMTMNRVIHAAVRRDLDRLRVALDAAPDGDVARARDLQRAYANLQRELEQHHEGEDAWIFPFLLGKGIDPILLQEMEDEHQAMADGLAETASTFTTYATSGASEDAARAASSVEETRKLVERHFVHEEQELEPALRPYHGSKELEDAEKHLRPGGPTAAGWMFAWLLDGIDEEEQTYLDATIPVPVTRFCARVLGRRYYREVAPVWQG